MLYLPRRHKVNLRLQLHFEHQILNSHHFLGYFVAVSAKGFYKEQDVIDFVSENLGRDVTPQSLEDRNFRLDKHRLEKAIRGKSA